MLKSKDSLGDYCSFKSALSASESVQIPAAKSTANVSKKKAQLLQPSSAESYRKESMIIGLRFEWREAKSKLHVMHKVDDWFVAASCLLGLKHCLWTTCNSCAAYHS